MPSPEVFLGILRGYGEATRAKAEREYQEEGQRRKTLADFYLKESQNQSNRPEAQHQFASNYLRIVQTPMHKKLDKDLESISPTIQIAPKPPPAQQVTTPAAQTATRSIGGEAVFGAPTPPIQVGGQPMSALGGPVADIAPPQPPPGMTETRPIRFTDEELRQREEQEAAARARGTAVGQVAGIQAKIPALREAFPDMSDEQIAAAVGIPYQRPAPLPLAPSAIAGTTPGSALKSTASMDSLGNPIDDKKYYKLMRNRQGEIVGIFPTETAPQQRLTQTEVEFKPGTPLYAEDPKSHRGMVNFDQASGRYYRGDEDVTDQVLGRYHVPSATLQIAQGASEAELDAMIDAVKTGQSTTEQVPPALRPRFYLRAAQREALLAPKTVRERLTDIGAARKLLDPIRQLVTQINKTKDLTEKVKLSFQLDGYVGSVAGILARNVGQERGVTTEGDVGRATGLVPGWKAANFVPDYAESQLKMLEQIIDSQDKALRVGYFQPIEKPGAPTAPPGQGGSVQFNYKGTNLQFPNQAALDAWKQAAGVQ